MPTMRLRVQDEDANVVAGLVGVSEDNALILMMVPETGEKAVRSLKIGESTWARDRKDVRYLIIRDEL